MLTLSELESVIPLVGASVPPTPQYAWPLLKSRTGVEIVVKHENHMAVIATPCRPPTRCASIRDRYSARSRSRQPVRREAVRAP